MARPLLFTEMTGTGAAVLPRLRMKSARQVSEEVPGVYRAFAARGVNHSPVVE